MSKMRSEFEHEVLRLSIIDDDGLEQHEDGSYIDEPAQAAWLAWQAALASSATTDPTSEPWAYAMMREGRVQGVERFKAQAERWVDAKAIPLAPMNFAAQSDLAAAILAAAPDNPYQVGSFADIIWMEGFNFALKAAAAAAALAKQVPAQEQNDQKKECDYLRTSGTHCNKCGEVHEAEKVCTCPSGDGSLRWPCPVHPPVERNPESAEMPQHYSAGDLNPDTFVYKRRDVVAMWKAMEGRFEPYEGLVARLRHQVDCLQEKLADKAAAQLAQSADTAEHNHD